MKCWTFLPAALLLVLGTLSLPALAQTVSAKGMGRVNYEGRLDPEERREAQRKATFAAIESHLAATSPAGMRAFDQRRTEFESKTDRYVLSSSILDENEDKAAKTYSVVIRADLNAALLEADIDAGSATASANPGQRSLMALVFVARAQASAQAFQDRVYERVDTTAQRDLSVGYSEKTSEGERIGASRIETDGSRNQQHSASGATSDTRTTGGSVTRRAEDVKWQVSNTAEINSAMVGVLGAAGYEVVEAEYVEGESGGLLRLDRIRADYSTGNDISPPVMRDTAAGVRNAGIKLLALGTLDVGARDTDPVTGQPRIFVTVNGKVLDVSGRFPRTVSSVGPVQFSGIGPTETVARTNALALASEQAAQVMADQMNARGVQ